MRKRRLLTQKDLVAITLKIAELNRLCVWDKSVRHSTQVKLCNFWLKLFTKSSPVLSKDDSRHYASDVGLFFSELFNRAINISNDAFIEAACAKYDFECSYKGYNKYHFRMELLN